VLYSSGEGTEQFDGGNVTPNLFRVLGVPALIGRGIAPDDGKPGAPPVFVMSYKMWSKRFNLDPTVLGRTYFFGSPKISEEAPLVNTSTRSRRYNAVQHGPATPSRACLQSAVRLHDDRDFQRPSLVTQRNDPALYRERSPNQFPLALASVRRWIQSSSPPSRLE
jgi:hypothetical protein